MLEIVISIVVILVVAFGYAILRRKKRETIERVRERIKARRGIQPLDPWGDGK